MTILLSQFIGTLIRLQLEIILQSDWSVAGTLNDLDTRYFAVAVQLCYLVMLLNFPDSLSFPEHMHIYNVYTIFLECHWIRY